MKKFLSILLVALTVCSFFATPAGATGAYECSVRRIVNGESVVDLTAYPANTEVTVEVTLTRSDITAASYSAWAVELDINTRGMKYVPGSGRGFAYTDAQGSHTVEPSAFTVGAVSGVGLLRFMTYTPSPETPFTLDKSVTVSARYLIEEPARAQAYAPTPSVYTGTEKEDVKNDCTVILNANGGAVNGQSALTLTAEVGKDITLPTPLRSGYRFLGWSDGSKLHKDSYTVVGDVTLNAQWEAETPDTEKDYVVDTTNAGSLNPTVSGLDEIAAAQTPPPGGSVTVRLTVTADANASTLDSRKRSLFADGKSAIRALAAGQTLQFFDLELERTETTASGSVSTTDIGDSNTHLLQIRIPFARGSRTNIRVYRYHNGVAESIGTTKNANGEYISVGSDSVTLWAMKFSAYAIGYHTPSQNDSSPDPVRPSPAPNNSIGGGGSSGSPGINPGVTITAPTTPTTPSTPTPAVGDALTARGDGSYTVGRSGVVTVPNIYGDVVAVIDPATGETLDLVEKSIVKDGSARALADSGSVIKVISNALPFSDVTEGSWYRNYVDFVSSHRLFNGATATQFQPNGSMTRAMLVTVLWRLEGKPAAARQAAYSDVPVGQWYSDAVDWAAEKVVVGGYDDGTFRPERNVTREEMAAILYRYMRFLGRDLTTDHTLGGFADSDQVSQWALPAVRWANANTILSGRNTASGVRLAPKDGATRAEVAAMLMRLVDGLVR